MSRTDHDRLNDAIFHLRSALATGEGEGFDDLWSDRIRRQSLIFDLIIVSKTLTKVSAEAKAQSSAIPWRRITDTRNRLIHAYWRQDRIFFEELLQHDAPDLLHAVEQLIASIGGKL